MEIMEHRGKHLGRLTASAKWFLFAVAADDRRRSVYDRLIAKARSSDVARRRDAVRDLPQPSVKIDRQVGFATCDPASFGGTEDVVDEVQRVSGTIFGDDAYAEKPYLADASLAADLSPSSPLLRFALNDQLVATAAEYLDAVPILSGIYALRSTHVPGPPTGSQLFHCDWEAVRQVKVFVHCGPVTAEDGPLTAIAAAASRRAKRYLRYRYGGAAFRVPDERMRPLVTDDEIRVFTGPSGAITLVDTSSCFHYGSRLGQDSRERFVVQFQYMPSSAFDLLLRHRSLHGLEDGSGSHSDVDRLVLGDPPAPPARRSP